jgi:type I restriction enzyme S subunit
VFFIHGDFWPLNTSLWVKEFNRVSPAYAFHLLSGLDFEMFNAGSAVPTLNRNHVHNLPVVIPPKPIVDAFDTLVMPLMKQQKANEDQSCNLATCVTHYCQNFCPAKFVSLIQKNLWRQSHD